MRLPLQPGCGPLQWQTAATFRLEWTWSRAFCGAAMAAAQPEFRTVGSSTGWLLNPFLCWLRILKTAQLSRKAP